MNVNCSLLLILATLTQIVQHTQCHRQLDTSSVMRFTDKMMMTMTDSMDHSTMFTEDWMSSVNLHRWRILSQWSHRSCLSAEEGIRKAYLCDFGSFQK